MDGKLSLHGAIVRQDLSELRSLLQSGQADLSDMDLVSNAAESSPEIAAELLRAGWDPNVRYPHFRQSFLMLAAANGNHQVVSVILAAGADVDLTDDTGQTAIYHAVSGRTRGHAECMRLLLDSGAKLDAPTQLTLLMTACRYASAAMVRELIRRGADVRRLARSGTPLVHAIQENRFEIVQVLLEHGASPDDRFLPQFENSEYAGKNAIEIAHDWGRKRLAELLQSASSGRRGEREAPPTVGSLWARIERRLIDLGEEVDAWLLPPATDLQTGAFRKWAETEVPDELLESLHIHNGQPPDAWLFQTTQEVESGEASDPASVFRFFTTDEIIRESRRMAEFVQGGVFAGVRPNAETGIREEVWNPGWLPIARNWAGDLWCLDLRPVEGGRDGQVIIVPHETGSRYRVATSYQELLGLLHVLPQLGEDGA